MAKKKKENTLQYLQMPLPEGGKYSKMTKVTFGGLNKRHTLDSGDLTMECNISTNEYPYLTPSNQKQRALSGYTNPISMFAFDDFVIVIYRKNSQIRIDYINSDNSVYTGILKSSGATSDDDVPRSVVQFNKYDVPTDPATGQYLKKLLFFTDKFSMYMNIVDTKTNPVDWGKDELDSADLNVMYCYSNGGYKYYYTVVLTEDTEDGDDDKVTYKRVIEKKFDENNPGYFLCDGMEALVKEYYNKTAEVDESGAIIYPPPDTASHNYYYRNSYNNDVYRWCEYETAKEDDDGNWVPDGGTTHGWKVRIPPNVPNLKYVTVHLSRVFGVDDDRVYASGFNDYTNWNLDTADEYNEANSWCSPSQANSKAGGKFTGITTFQNHVVCFKRDFIRIS